MPKNIVICCDGTGNEYCKKKTNVAKLYDIAEKQTERQIAYYDPGVGTLGSTLAITWVGKKLSWLFGLAFAFGLPENIEDAYSFLMENYEEGDRIFLFGFSRGAYTVRALGGMITKCGLLHKEHKNLIHYATKLYRDRKKKADHAKVKSFRSAFSHDSCAPYFIGVWDTVKSVGMKNKIRFGDKSLSKKVPYGFHALSIDERRFKFRPVLWDEPAADKQTIEQVWFPGVHCDVGGSYERDGLSNIALQWMIKKAAEQGLIADTEEFEKIAPDCGQGRNKSYKGFWRLLGIHIRDIINEGKDKKKKKKEETEEKKPLVHASAFKRMEKVRKYRPRNLLRVRDRITPVDEDMEC